MSIRVRLIYEKRGGACFVPHISLASLFTRSAMRAGLSLSMTQGFSPHPKMSFGPELPAGVVALNEPVDIWVEEVPSEFLELWNKAMPEGFHIVSAVFPAEDSPRLGTLCQAARYLVRAVETDNPISCSDLLSNATEYYGEAVLRSEIECNVEENTQTDWLALTLAEPAQNPIGGWVKAMIASNCISGWQNLNIVRTDIGTWDKEKRMLRSLKENTEA